MTTKLNAEKRLELLKIARLVKSNITRASLFSHDEDKVQKKAISTILYLLEEILLEKEEAEPAREGLHFNSSEYLKTSSNQKIEVTYAANGKIHSIKIVE